MVNRSPSFRSRQEAKALVIDVQNFVYVPAFVLPESFRLDYGNQDFAENVIGEYVQMSRLYKEDSRIG